MRETIKQLNMKTISILFSLFAMTATANAAMPVKTAKSAGSPMRHNEEQLTFQSEARCRCTRRKQRRPAGRIHNLRRGKRAADRMERKFRQRLRWLDAQQCRQLLVGIEAGQRSSFHGN